MSYCSSDLQTPLGLVTPNQSQQMLALGGPPSPSAGQRCWEPEGTKLLVSLAPSLLFLQTRSLFREL